jgi:hypothetical protein
MLSAASPESLEQKVNELLAKHMELYSGPFAAWANNHITFYQALTSQEVVQQNYYPPSSRPAESSAVREG